MMINDIVGGEETTVHKSETKNHSSVALCFPGGETEDLHASNSSRSPETKALQLIKRNGSSTGPTLKGNYSLSPEVGCKQCNQPSQQTKEAGARLPNKPTGLLALVRKAVRARKAGEEGTWSQGQVRQSFINTQPMGRTPRAAELYL